MENKEKLHDDALTNVSGGFIYADTKGTILMLLFPAADKHIQGDLPSSFSND